MNLETEHVALLRRAYDAFNRRDIDEALSLLDPEVDWPNVLDGTTVHGREAVRRYWERQFQEFEPHVEPTGFFAHGDGIIVAVHNVVRDRQGNLLSDSHVAHAYMFRDGLVLSMSVYPTVDAAGT